MIVAERKPFDEIMEMVASCKRVLVLGCGGCVTVCLTGGERQAEMLASQLRLAAGAKGLEMEVEFDSITRQCDKEFFANLKKDLASYDAVISIACGVGVQYMGEQFASARILPGMNTQHLAANTAPGVWTEYCHGCGECVLAWTGGICPIARCSKSLVNGACGGTNHGKCEVKAEMDCGWLLIYKKLQETGRLDELRKLRPPRNWRKDRSDGVRRLVLKDMVEEETKS